MAISIPHGKDAVDLAHYRDSLAATASPAKGAKPEPLYDTVFDRTYGVFWTYLKSTSPPRFTPTLLSVLRQSQLDFEARVRQELAVKHKHRVRYHVFVSRIPGIFSLGGDLEFFRQAIAAQDRQALSAYARDCIDLVYAYAVNYKLPVTTISLVQGTALGGGFEAALAANVVVAERQCEMGFPETMFNMFPGMGAYQLLTRRLTPVEAERFILSGRVYRAEELYEMNLVDVLADEGRGEEAVSNYIRRHQRRAHGSQGLRRAIQATSPIRYEDLRETIGIWLDTALNLDPTDLKHLDYLIRAQDQKNR
jgi:DSF synthase